MTSPLALAPRMGSADDAFEELCCQLAYADVADKAGFRRVLGKGGDGGVECYWTSAAGEVHGWQAKHIFDLGRALTKAAASFTVARGRHPRLSRYVVCLPVDLSGSQGAGGQSQQDRFDAFKAKAEAEALADGQRVVVEPWAAFTIRQRLIASDPSGGHQRYWFDPNHLGEAWFSAHIDDAIRRAGPRYTPKLHHGHVLDETLAALGDTPAWREVVAAWARRARDAATQWSSTMAHSAKGWSGEFPPPAAVHGSDLNTALARLAAALEGDDLVGSEAIAEAATRSAMLCVLDLVTDLETRFGPGTARSVPFWQRWVEIHAERPADHLRDCDGVHGMLLELVVWLASAAIPANRDRVLLLSGPAGIGKTHGLCDVARSRRSSGLATVLVSGPQFSADGSPWAALAVALGLDASWTRDVLLDALDAAGAKLQAEGGLRGRVLLCIDALDERRDRSRWLDDLPEIVAAVRQRPHLALCVSFRDGYQRQVLRSDLNLSRFAHPGFTGAVFDACSAFFKHFDLDPPVGPLLEPELGNPLFLLVLCRTLKARGLRAIPPGRIGTGEALAQLLIWRDDELHKRSPALGTAAVSRSMLAVAGALPEGGTLGWAEADAVVEGTLPPSQRGRNDLLEHLVSAGLLRQLPPTSDGWPPAEDRVDIAFGRLRHHLLADRVTRTDGRPPPDGLRAMALADPGLAESIAVILPERNGGELVDLASDPDERTTLFEPWLAALPWRDPATLGDRVEALVREALADPTVDHMAWDALFTLALRPGHRYDHRFLHRLLGGMPMPQRDSALCSYLHAVFDRGGTPSPVLRVLRAPWEIDAVKVARPLRTAWCAVLAWCCAAADLRVRDEATKAAVRLTETDLGVWAGLVEMFADVDDDSVLERVLCAAYGAVLRNPEPEPLRELSQVVLDRVLRRQSGTPRHALVRGHAQCIGEWAAHRGVLPAGLVVANFRPPHSAPVALHAPTEAALKRYADHGEYPRLYASVMDSFSGDFAAYTMPGVLGGYEKLMAAGVTRRWVLAEVIALGYDPALHANYDHEMIQDYGHGREKPVWAERIGKKYQRIALARLVGALDDLARSRAKAPAGLACERLRDLDPSVLQREPLDHDIHLSGRWCSAGPMDFAATASLTEAGWVAEDDFVCPDGLVAPRTDPALPMQRWRLLNGFFRWDNRTFKQERRYRDAWMMVKGYVVPRRKLGACRKALADQDFMGRWMVDGSDLGGGIYFGEYPWSPCFPDAMAMPEAYGARQEPLAKLGLRPATNHMSSTGEDWNGGSVGLTVPSAELVGATTTRWDGVRGFETENGRLIFQDPAAGVGGLTGLWVDDDSLSELCERLDVRVLWTVLAERRIMGDDGDKNFAGMKHASWTMWLDGGRVGIKRGRGEHFRADRSRGPG